MVPTLKLPLHLIVLFGWSQRRGGDPTTMEFWAHWVKVEAESKKVEQMLKFDAVYGKGQEQIHMQKGKRFYRPVLSSLHTLGGTKRRLILYWNFFWVVM